MNVKDHGKCTPGAVLGTGVSDAGGEATGAGGTLSPPTADPAPGAAAAQLLSDWRSRSLRYATAVLIQLSVPADFPIHFYFFIQAFYFRTVVDFQKNYTQHGELSHCRLPRGEPLPWAWRPELP